MKEIIMVDDGSHEDIPSSSEHIHGPKVVPSIANIESLSLSRSRQQGNSLVAGINDDFIVHVPDKLTYESLKKYDESIEKTDREVEERGDIFFRRPPSRYIKKSIHARGELTIGDNLIKKIHRKKSFRFVRANEFNNDSGMASRLVYQQYVENMLWYTRLVPRYVFMHEAAARGIRISVPRYKESGEYNIRMYHVAYTAILTRLPIGTWLFADIADIYNRGVISLYDEVSFKISGAYFTDGVYFYSKEFENMYPIGSIALRPIIDSKVDTRAYIIDTNYFLRIPSNTKSSQKGAKDGDGKK